MKSRRTPWIAGVSALALVLAACGSSSTGSGTSATSAATSAATGETSAAGGDTSAGGGGAGGAELVIWADNSANTAKAIEPLCKKWAADNGVTCTVKKFNGGGDLQDALTPATPSGEVPDLFEAAARPHRRVMSRTASSRRSTLPSNKDKFSAVACRPWPTLARPTVCRGRSRTSPCSPTRHWRRNARRRIDDAVANAKEADRSG